MSDLIAFARECADPDWSLSIPPVAKGVIAQLLAELEAIAPILRDLADREECWFDHHGGCQAHGYIGLQPGETCPQHDAKVWLKSHGIEVAP